MSTKRSFAAGDAQAAVRASRGALAIVLGFALCACAGGGSGGGAPITPRPPTPPPPPPVSISEAEAARFLTQATFGPTRADIARVREIGYSAWLDEQMDPARTPQTSVLAHLQQTLAAGLDPKALGQAHRRNAWLWLAANNRDQLRMRMAFAIGEIFVISDFESAQPQVQRVADYQDTLARNAFGSYRELLKSVTLHPAMGAYLSHAGNRKASADGKIVPDENYGREVMQLFSIGLVERNLDFSPALDAAGQTVPTYDSAVVAAMSRVFTGWTYAGLSDANYSRVDARSYAPMECHPAYHDDQPKAIFRGIVINDGSNCSAGLEQVVDALSNHPNTAPFISRQLIQRFVTSNPSPAYIRRVAQTWVDSNGDLGRVLRAILLDDAARSTPAAGDATFGKPREPLLRIVHLWRAYEAKYVPPADGSLRFRVSNMGDLTVSIAQDSQRAPSVFNFFEPDYRIPMVDGSQGPYAPELQIITESTFTTGHNQADALLWNYASTAAPTANTNAPVLDIARLVQLADAGDHAGMVSDVNLLLFGGGLSTASSGTLTRMLDSLRSQGRSSSERARSLLLLAMLSPDYAIQR
jgi:uncharacterized protein (DUF1800 family)